MNNNKTLMKANVRDGKRKNSQIFSCPFERCFPSQNIFTEHAKGDFNGEF